MKVMIDTNIIISAVLFPQGKAAHAFEKAIMPPYQPIICDYILDELHRKFKEKFPICSTELDAFLYHALSLIQVVEMPYLENKQESKIRDVKDRPILRAAIKAHADLLLTGDKDFLESAIDAPRIIGVPEFLAMV